jgi:hypothetical protein
MVVGFQYLADAHRFLAELKKRLEAFALELYPTRPGSSSSGGSFLRTAGLAVRASLKPSPSSPTSAGGSSRAGG